MGLLDFQDALMGHPAYDLVSLLQDARRDTDISMQNRMLDYYLKQSQLHHDDFRASYYLLGAQRNLKIMGIFARLLKRDQKPNYISYLPRVYKHLLHCLDHPACEYLRDWVHTHLPAPTPQVLERLR